MTVQTARWIDAEHAAISATIDDVLMSIPNDMANRHRQLIAEWETKGNAIAEYVAPVVTPTQISLTKRQINRALIESGATTDPDGFVRNALKAITDPKTYALALNDWENASIYDRSHPLLNDPALMAAVGMTKAQIDQLWMMGQTYPA